MGQKHQLLNDSYSFDITRYNFNYLKITYFYRILFGEYSVFKKHFCNMKY